jgi:hypothetical protein
MAAAIIAMVNVSASAQTPAGPWEIGPTIGNRNYSVGLPSTLTRGSNGLRVAIGPSAEPHYVTVRHGSLRGKSQIRMRFRIVGPNNAIVHGAKCSLNSSATVTLYFQRKDDDWATDGGRWWATFASVPLKVSTNEMEIVAPLNGKWTSVSRMTAENNPDAFVAAKANADRVGFTFGNCEGFGHGARATLPVSFVMTRFQVR